MQSALTGTTNLVLLLGALQASAAGGAIQLSSARLTVEPRQRTAGITLTNRSAQEQRYRVSIIDMVMDLNGLVSEVGADKPSHARSASHWVLATPATIRLAPGESQKIRLLVRRPGGLPDGEYRAHLSVAQEPPVDIAGGLRETVSADVGLQLDITTVHTTVLPIFIEQGRTYSNASIVGARLLEDGKRVIISLKREGNASFRGFVRAMAGNAKPIYVPCVIYPELDQVNVAYDMGVLVNTTQAVTLNLYAGIIPKQGGMPATQVLSSISLAH
jgi:hypothetical protein